MASNSSSGVAKMAENPRIQGGARSRKCSLCKILPARNPAHYHPETRRTKPSYNAAKHAARRIAMQRLVLRTLTSCAPWSGLVFTAISKASHLSARRLWSSSMQGMLLFFTWCQHLSTYQPTLATQQSAEENAWTFLRCCAAVDDD